MGEVKLTSMISFIPSRLHHRLVMITMAQWERSFRFIQIILRVVSRCLSKLVGVSHGLMGQLMVYPNCRVCGKCLSKLVGVCHGLMGQLMVLNRVVSLVGGYFESIWWRQCVSVCSCYYWVQWTAGSYQVTCQTGHWLTNSYCDVRFAELGLRYQQANASDNSVSDQCCQANFVSDYQVCLCFWGVSWLVLSDSSVCQTVCQVLCQTTGSVCVSGVCPG